MEFIDWLLIVLGVIALVVACVILYNPLKRVNYRKNYVRIYYRDVYKVAKYNDYYLINNLILKLDETSHIKVDHLLIGDKYIYVIDDLYHHGEVKAKVQDETWVFTTKKKTKKEYKNNLLIKNRQRIEKVALITNLNPELFISVILVNDDLVINGLELDSKMDYVVKRKDLYRHITAIEKRPVDPLEEEKLAQAVLDIDALNLKHIMKKGKLK